MIRCAGMGDKGRERERREISSARRCTMETDMVGEEGSGEGGDLWKEMGERSG